MKKSWLLYQFKAARKEVNSWSKCKQEAMRAAARSSFEIEADDLRREVYSVTELLNRTKRE